ncbi:hypothetical protein T09_1890 [Trichinella sp. T9]|uniref:Uncharacterized protein n=1 Tax=Trichinella murrelli TaxID=144512 RepID=A0A0V0TZ64_9BILA|nr:hypothetical protein T05_15198 [Trichinella murrelli]KRX65552.1 hypothetical protein T09_1890 [Trichinella sp. T9]
MKQKWSCVCVSVLIADRIVIVLAAHEIKGFTDSLLFYTLRAPLKKLFSQILAQMADKLALRIA